MSAPKTSEGVTGMVRVSDILGAIGRRWRLLTALMLLGGFVAYGWSAWAVTPVYSGHLLVRVSQYAGQRVVPTAEVRALLMDPGYLAAEVSEGAAVGSGVRVAYVDSVAGTLDSLVTVEGGSASMVRRTLELLPASLTRRYGSRFDDKERQSGEVIAAIGDLLDSLEADVKATGADLTQDRDPGDDIGVALLRASLSLMLENVRKARTQLYVLTRVPPGSREFVAETGPVVGDLPVRPAMAFNVVVGATAGMLLAILVALWSMLLTGSRAEAATRTGISSRQPDEM
jgi:hypothetical protein